MVDVEGFEGPLDLLLMLARQQKVDLAKISILALADQYLAFIEEARRLRLELAADYLVMAAWLAYLKSRLLLPDAACAGGPERRGHGQCAGAAAQRLEAIRDVAEQLLARPQLDRDVFAPRRAASRSPTSSTRNGRRRSTICSSAYAQQRQRTALAHVRFAKRTVWSLAEAREALERLIGQATDWTPARRISDRLCGRAVAGCRPCWRRALPPTLELVREGLADVHQQQAVRAALCAQAASGERRPAIGAGAGAAAAGDDSD